ncbi:MAG: hypothetical protein EBR23_13230, partial [Planctomycetia bacterium]|nr:hypothetical protein [Planctomycetia bacterium]
MATIEAPDTATLETHCRRIAERARRAAIDLATLPAEQKAAALRAAAARIRADAGEILGVDDRCDERLRFEGGGQCMEILTELTGAQREEVLDGGDQLGERLRPLGEVVGIEDQRL